MTPVEAIAIAVAVIFALIEAVKKVIPALATTYSNYIPLISLTLGIIAAVIIFYTIPGASLWVLLGGVVTALGASGLYSTINTAKDAYSNYQINKTTDITVDTIVSPNDDYPASE